MGVHHYSKIYLNGVEFCDGPIVDLEHAPVSERRLIGVDYASTDSFSISLAVKLDDDGQFREFMEAIASDPYRVARQADREAAAGDPSLKLVRKIGLLHHLVMTSKPATHAQRRHMKMALRRTARAIRKIQAKGGA